MTEPLWTVDELVGILGEPACAGAPASGVSIDTRTLSSGDLFIAIRGEANDGHRFVEMALAKGAAGAVVARGDEAARGPGARYAVDDTLAAMEKLGRAARARAHAGIVAVTGSVGKTSTKEALRVVFSAFGPTHASAASYNNHWGVPLTLARLPRAARFGIFEIGMNHAGEITPLVGMARPHVAIVTNVGPVHLENFGSVEAIADAKAEIFSALQPGGAAILHHDGPHFDRLAGAARAAGAARVLTFGERPEADARLISCGPDRHGAHVVAEILRRPFSFFLGAPGRHLATNALAALLAASALDCDLAKAAAALAAFAPASGRGARAELRRDGAPFTLIDESYNANPASMRAALSLLGETMADRRIAVLGDMLELGAQSGRLHEELREPIGEAGVDLVFAAGPMMKRLYDALPADKRGAWAPDSTTLEAAVLACARGGDALMVKGSNGSRMAPIVAALRQRFAGQPPRD